MTFTVKAVSQRYGVSEHTDLMWIKQGAIRAINVGRRPGTQKPRWRIAQAALEGFEALRAATPPVPPTRRRKQPANIIEFYK
jgi:hypothetical protein